MHWITIIGLILIAIGSYLTYLGQSRSNEEQIKEVKNTFIAKFDAIIDDSTMKNNPQEIEKMRDEFQEWAEHFVKNKDKAILSIEQANLNVEKKKIQLSEQHKKIYDYLFQNIIEHINAYNLTAKDSITYNIPKIPSNIFSLDASNYKAKVRFSKNVFWYFKLVVSEPIDKDEIPTIWFYALEKETDDLRIESHDMIISFDIPNNVIYVLKISNKLKLIGIDTNYDLTNYKDNINILIRKMIETQILK